MTFLAGCPGNDDPEEEEDPEEEPEEEPADDPDGEEEPDGEGDEQLDAYLSENDANEYDGDIEDHTGEDEVTVEVGAGGDGFAFAPPAIRVDTGTTIVWEWTGDGGGHNVAPDDESGFDDFGDSEIVDDEGRTVEDTFDDSGVGLYVCEPHAGVNMYGGFVVE